MTYDSAGNLTNDTFSGQGQRIYDAENRMTQAQGSPNSQWQTYTYDASGQRVRRNVNGVETWAVYGLGGELLAEYAANAPAASPQKEYGYRNGQLLITAEVPVTTSATFVQTDTTTLGNWKGVYGSDGYNVINDAVSYPAYAQVSVSGQSAYTWAASTSDVRALLKAASPTDRLAACWYSGSNFTVDVNLTDGNIHRVAVYSLDWDGNNSRQERLEILDAVSNAVLDSRDVTSYSGGKYSVWDLQGHVKIKVTHLGPAGSNAVISGLFFGPAQQNVSWTNVSSTITVTANSIQKTSGTNAWDAGAVSTQTIASGNGYVDFVPGENVTWRMCGLGNGDSSTYYSDIEYAFFMDGGGGLSIYESGNYRGAFGAYAASDHLKVAVENGVVKYYRNATVLYTSTVAPQYPLLVDTSLNTVNAGVYNVVIAGTATSSTGAIQWLVTDQLGTPRMVFDKTGTLATTKRHDYLPFGEELSSGQGVRNTTLGYGASDGVRQKFTNQERDNETGLDYMHARYFASAQGRFTSADSVAGSIGNPQSLNRYAYVGNNPMNFSDPTGHMPSIHLNPKPGQDGGDEGYSYSWDDPTSPQAVLQAAGILSERLQNEANNWALADGAKYGCSNCPVKHSVANLLAMGTGSTSQAKPEVRVSEIELLGDWGDDPTSPAVGKGSVDAFDYSDNPSKYILDVNQGGIDPNSIFTVAITFKGLKTDGWVPDSAKATAPTNGRWNLVETPTGLGPVRKRPKGDMLTILLNIRARDIGAQNKPISLQVSAFYTSLYRKDGRAGIDHDTVTKQIFIKLLIGESKSTVREVP